MTEATIGALMIRIGFWRFLIMFTYKYSIMGPTTLF